MSIVSAERDGRKITDWLELGSIQLIRDLVQPDPEDYGKPPGWTPPERDDALEPEREYDVTFQLTATWTTRVRARSKDEALVLAGDEYDSGISLYDLEDVEVDHESVVELTPNPPSRDWAQPLPSNPLDPSLPLVRAAQGRPT